MSQEKQTFTMEQLKERQTNANKEAFKKYLEAQQYVVVCPMARSLIGNDGKLCIGCQCPMFVARRQTTSGSVAGNCKLTLKQGENENKSLLIYFDFNAAAWCFWHTPLVAPVPKPPPSKPNAEFKDVFVQEG